MTVSVEQQARDIVDRAREALDGITDGPWMAGRGRDGFAHWVDTKPDLACIPIADGIDNLADAEFIAEAPELVRNLTAEVTRLRAQHQSTIAAYQRASSSETAWRSNAETERGRLRAQLQRTRECR